MNGKQGFFVTKDNKNSREKGADNNRKLLAWTYKWGWVTETSVMRVMGYKTRCAKKFVARGILAAKDPVANVGRAYVLAPQSVSQALVAYENCPNSILGLAYPWVKHSPPVARMTNHMELSQTIAIEEMARGDGDLLCEREMLEGGAFARPDFQITRGESIEWHEVELESKYKERLWLQLHMRNEALKAGKFTRIVWWCLTQGVARRLTEALSSAIIPMAEKKADGKVVQIKTEEGWSPLRLNVASEIIVIGNQRKA